MGGLFAIIAAGALPAAIGLFLWSVCEQGYSPRERAWRAPLVIILASVGIASIVASQVYQ